MSNVYWDFSDFAGKLLRNIIYFWIKFNSWDFLRLILVEHEISICCFKSWSIPRHGFSMGSKILPGKGHNHNTRLRNVLWVQNQLVTFISFCFCFVPYHLSYPQIEYDKAFWKSLIWTRFLSIQKVIPH